MMEGDDRWRKSERVSQLRDQNEWYMPYSTTSGCVRDFAFHNQFIFAAVEVGGLLYSNDYGATWDLVQGSIGKPHQEPLAGQTRQPIMENLEERWQDDMVERFISAD